LKDFPEISYFAIKTGKPLLEVGKRTGGSRSSFPIIIKGREIGQILTEDDPDYLAAQFRNVVLDFGVVVLVIILFAFELIIIMMSASLTGPFDRLLHLVDLQAAGDFSKCLDRKVRNAIERVGALLSERAEELNALFAHALRDIGNRSGSTAVPSELLELAEDFRLRHSRPDILRFCSISDIRLALFLFTAADQLPLSFFSLYVRSAENPLTWLNPGLVISLPLAGYLLAALVGAALARPIAQRFGHRSEFLIGALLAFVSNLGLFIAGDVISIIIYSALNGLGFALASLACQDYVIDRLPKDERPRKLALVSAALFGGVLAGTALGGVVADRIGQRPVFVVSAFLVLVSAVLIVRFLPHGRIKSPERTEHRTWSLHFLAPLGNFRFAAVTYGIVVPQVIADQVFVSYLLALAMDGLGSSVADIGRVMMVYFLVLIAAGAVYDKLPPRFANPSGVALASSLLSGASLLMAALHPSSWSYLLGAMGAGIGHGLSRGPQSALTVDLAEGALAHFGSNVVLGAVRILERGGSVVGLLAIGFLTSTIGYAGATGAIGLILLAGAAGFAMALVAQAGRIIFQGRNV
jgi:MFS family permease